MRRRLRIISVLLIWDNNKSSFEPIEIDKDFLQKISDRLPMPEERQRMKIRLKSRALKAL